MKNINTLLIAIILVSAKFSFAQDGVFKFKKVEISFAPIVTQDSLIGLELYQNDLFITMDKKKNIESKCMAKFDESTGIYTLAYSYQGIGGGSDNRMPCPTLFAKVDLITKERQEYFYTIPIVLSICNLSQASEINVLNIDLNRLLGQPNRLVEVNEINAYSITSAEDVYQGRLVKIERKPSFYK